MKYCYKCGKELVDEAVMCTGCGHMLDKIKLPGKKKDEASFGYGLLGFLFPWLGLVLWLIWKDNTPLRARSAGKGALVSTIAFVSFVVLVTIAYFVALFCFIGKI